MTRRHKMLRRHTATVSKSSKKRERDRAKEKRARDRGRRLHDLYERLHLACGLPPEEAVQICKTIVNDSILDDDVYLESVTGVRTETFDVHLDALKNAYDADPESPLYHGRPGRETDPGRRSHLHPAHRLLMYLESKKHGGSQMQLAARYGASQSTVSKCIECTENALGRFAATADNIKERMDEARTEAKLQSALREVLACLLHLAQASTARLASVSKTLPHNRIIRDGTHTPHCRPSDENVRDPMWSGKKKMYSFNTLVDSNERGVTVGLSGCWPGSWHDMRIQSIEEEEDGGILTRCLLGKSTAMVIYEYGDKGLQGLQNLHPGAVVRTPPKKKRGKDLTKTEREDGMRVGRVRITIEHTNGRYKKFACMRNKFHGGAEKLRKTANVLSGLINYHLAMGLASPENTHRKQKKPGPKTYRNRGR